MDRPADDLSECHEMVEQLQEEKKELLEVKKELLEEKKELLQENEQLRESADTFGELAERLNLALGEERQSGAPSPAIVPGPRGAPDVKAPSEG